MCDRAALQTHTHIEARIVNVRVAALHKRLADTLLACDVVKEDRLDDAHWLPCACALCGALFGCQGGGARVTHARGVAIVDVLLEHSVPEEQLLRALLRTSNLSRRAEVCYRCRA